MGDVERLIHEFIANVLLDGEDVAFDEHTPLLADRLIDSLNVEELIVYVNEKFAVSLDDWPYRDWQTIHGMAELIRTHSPRARAATSTTTSWPS